jgi:pyrroline-5-carboxylate reductase
MAELLVWAVKPQNFEVAAGIVRRSCRRRAAGERHGRRAQRRHRRRDRQRARHPRHAEHAGADRPGHRRAVRRAAVTDEDRADAVALLAPTGELIWVGEEVQLDAVTALSGSGPAYVFLLLESLHEAGRQMGLPPAVARRLAEQTVAGSAALAAASPDSPAELRRIVTSPGGTTEAAMAVLETRGARDAFIAAVLAARAKAEALGKPAVAPRSTLLPPSS